MPEEMTVVRMLNTLVRTPLTELDSAVTEMIGKMTDLAGAGWGCLFRLEKDQLVATHKFLTDGVDPLNCPLEYMIGKSRAILERKEHVLLSDVRDLPAESPLRALEPARSLLALPIHDGERLAGVLAFAFKDPLPEMEASCLEFLRSAAEVIETVLARREAEMAHRDTARRLEATLAALPDLLFEVTPDGHFAEFTAGPNDLMAAPRGSLRGKHFASILPADVSRIIQSALEKTLAEGRVSGIRYRLDLKLSLIHI